ncbi:Rrf2 family transcriptional regulator [Gallaecimonas xiamenensis]|uniref:BadM/Rrf2 family transcriptional regulator n=1 Tax=Gallaecimonas xiamenensis 3-C-1 TaxID=745411 RepID=K2J8R4_9GAMM|nr:Rrf2 family transcriptional regulator [Gallaecimonas xiamenensis]EKE71618.1 BadM/Rrf2 family transcriptional regulator [Gallaecimonas xiamenensis 3-C-1]
MKQNNSLSSCLHLLLHMAQGNKAVTSEQLATFLDTNPVVVRKMLAGLREHQLVQSDKGHKGGWRLKKPLDAIRLYDVYQALGSPGLFAIGNRKDNPQCLVEQGVNRVMDQALASAQTLILDQFQTLTLFDIGQEFLAHPWSDTDTLKGGHHE